MFCYHPQKKSQKRKFKDGNFDEDMDIEPQKYKGMISTKYAFYVKNVKTDSF